MYLCCLQETCCGPPQAACTVAPTRPCSISLQQRLPGQLPSVHALPSLSMQTVSTACLCPGAAFRAGRPCWAQLWCCWPCVMASTAQLPSHM